MGLLIFYAHRASPIGDCRDVVSNTLKSNMDASKLRAWWSYRQGLDGSQQGQTPADILKHTGWARSVGGAGPYLTLFVRGNIRRATADAALLNLEIHELPSTRGCTYVLPSEDFALALKLSQSFAGSEMKVASKLGVTEGEIDKLCAAVLQALKSGPLEPEELRSATGGASRSLGNEGKKKGLTTTLPLALERLQSSGDIRRIPADGRLDRQRYRYALWNPNPLKAFTLSGEEAFTELARRYFTWAGPATLAEFRWFSALGATAAKNAVAPLRLEPLPDSGGRLMMPGDREQLEAFQAPNEAQYVLTSGLDGLALLRRNLPSLLGPEDLPSVKGLTDLPNHAIFDRGTLVGLWEYDVETESIAWRSFGPKPAAMKNSVEQMERFVREDLGDARSFSLDSPKSRIPRIEELRKAATAS